MNLYRTDDLLEVAVLAMHGIEPLTRVRDRKTNRQVAEFGEHPLLKATLEAIAFGTLTVSFRALRDAHRDECRNLRAGTIASAITLDRDVKRVQGQ